MALRGIDVPISPDDLLRTSKDSSKSSTRFHGFRTFQQKAETLLKGRLDAERNRLSSMGVRATESEDLECDSGFGTGTFTFSDPLVVTAGDSITMSFSNCEFVDDGEIYNGSLTMTFKDIGPNMSFAFSFNNFQIKEKFTGDSMLMHGDYTLTTLINLPKTSVQLVSNSLLVNEVYQGDEFSTLLTGLDQSAVHDSSVGSDTYKANFTVTDSHFGGKVTVETRTDFVVTSSVATDGEMIITGANGAKIRLKAQSSPNVLVEYDLDGDGSYGDQPSETLDLRDLGKEQT